MGDDSIPEQNRVTFGIIYPCELHLASIFMYFDKTKPLEHVVAGAAKKHGLVLDNGKMPGSPERLNVFTCEGELVRRDLDIDAHLGSTLRPGSVLLLEKGNRVSPSRLAAVCELLATTAT